LKTRNAEVRSRHLFNSVAIQKNYPLRAIRYWWVFCALVEERERIGRPLEIVDMGCGKGIMRHFAGNGIDGRWTGLDWRVNTSNLEAAGYTTMHDCDFDQPLPQADQSVDAVIFLHVIEHLPRPVHTLAEIARILRPGGVLLAGSPIAPKWIAQTREKLFKRQLQAGLRKPGRHINSFWPMRWRESVATAGLGLDFSTGAFLARCSGSPLENFSWWPPLNNLWGGLFPSLGSEYYLRARKPDLANCPTNFEMANLRECVSLTS
jgi:SAM-dependent methyltransferase